MGTFQAKKGEVDRQWVLIDAKAENVARLCNSLKTGGTAHILTSSLCKSTEELTIRQRFTIKNVTAARPQPL